VAALGRRHVAEHLLDVGTATGPGGLVALGTGRCSTHTP